MQSEKQDNFTALACSFPQRLTAKDTELYFFPPPPAQKSTTFVPKFWTLWRGDRTSLWGLKVLVSWLGALSSHPFQRGQLSPLGQAGDVRAEMGAPGPAREWLQNLWGAQGLSLVGPWAGRKLSLQCPTAGLTAAEALGGAITAPRANPALS